MQLLHKYVFVFVLLIGDIDIIVSQGHKHVVKALASEYKAQVNVQSNQGTTPLYHACEGGRYSITKTLLEAGADTELGQKDGRKPIHGAVRLLLLFITFAYLDDEN